MNNLEITLPVPFEIELLAIIDEDGFKVYFEIFNEQYNIPNDKNIIDKFERILKDFISNKFDIDKSRLGELTVCEANSSIKFDISESEFTEFESKYKDIFGITKTNFIK